MPDPESARAARPTRLRQIVLTAGAVVLVAEVVAVVAVLTSDLSGEAKLLGLAVSLLVVVQLVSAVLLVAMVAEARRQRQARRKLEVLLRRRTRAQGRRLTRLVERSNATSALVSSLARAHAQGVAEARQAEAKGRTNLVRRAEQLHVDTQRQVQALLQLDRMVTLDQEAPPMGGWAASPDLVLLCVQTLLDERPGTVVECGSGVTTLYLALTAAQHDLPTRLVTLEHDELYARKTEEMLRRHGVRDRVDLVFAPLEPAGIEGHETPWYATSALADVDEVGIVLVDGPPGLTGPRARFPALPVLHDRLAPRCVVIMDDLNRDEDREVAEAWASLLPDFHLEIDQTFQKKVGLLRRSDD